MMDQDQDYQKADIIFNSILTKNKNSSNSHLLKVGDLTMMLDCGSDERFSKSNLQKIIDTIEQQNVDFIFLSFASLTNVGALPYLQALHKIDNVKIMSTSPTAKMGALTMYEYFIQKKEKESFDYFTLQDVEKVFERIELVSFNENRRIRIRETEVILSALPSGGAIGGTCWKIEYNKQVIIYAVDLNDIPLNITVPIKYEEFKNSNIIISNAYMAPQVFKGTQKFQTMKNYKFISEEKLRQKLEKVLVDNGGQIMLPLTDKNRILQCLITLENMFQTNSKLQAGLRTQTSPVVYLEAMSRDTLGVGRSHLGWMNFQDNKVFQDIDENPINFQFVKDIFTLDEYRQLDDGPRVIVTSMASFEQGFTKQLIREFSQKQKNEVIFTQRVSFAKDSLGRRLLEGEKDFKMNECSIIGILDGDSTDLSGPFGIKRRESENSTQLGPRRSIEFNQSQMEIDSDLQMSHHNSTNFHNQQLLDQQKLTFAQNQFLQTQENFRNKINEKQYRKNFQAGNYPLMSHFPLDTIKPLNFYGEDQIEERNDIEINQEMEEVQQAITNVQQEKRQQDNYNRFKDLQRRYGKQFLYSNQDVSFTVKCKVSYIPFEARLEKVSFELLIREAKPKDLILINSSKKKADKIQDFINSNGISVRVHVANQYSPSQDGEQMITFNTNAAVKQVFLDEKLYKSLPVQKVHKKYEIARVKGVIEILPSQDGVTTSSVTVFDTLQQVPLLSESERRREQFERKNLFFRSKDYKLSDLQQFLEAQNMPTVLVDKCLNHDDKIFIYFDESGQIRFEGMICKEYFALRTLIYQHFGRI